MYSKKTMLGPRPSWLSWSWKFQASQAFSKHITQTSRRVFLWLVRRFDGSVDRLHLDGVPRAWAGPERPAEAFGDGGHQGLREGPEEVTERCQRRPAQPQARPNHPDMLQLKSAMRWKSLTPKYSMAVWPRESPLQCGDTTRNTAVYAGCLPTPTFNNLLLTANRFSYYTKGVLNWICDSTMHEPCKVNRCKLDTITCLVARFTSAPLRHAWCCLSVLVTATERSATRQRLA